MRVFGRNAWWMDFGTYSQQLSNTIKNYQAHTVAMLDSKTNIATFAGKNPEYRGQDPATVRITFDTEQQKVLWDESGEATGGAT